jgi:hypothetical protein
MATATDSSGNVVIGSQPFGVALISPASQSMSFGQTGVTFTSSSSGQWFSGVPAVAQVTTGDPVLFTGATATIQTGGIPTGFPSSLVVPIYCMIQTPPTQIFISQPSINWLSSRRVIASAQLTVNNIP